MHACIISYMHTNWNYEWRWETPAISFRENKYGHFIVHIILNDDKVLQEAARKKMANLPTVSTLDQDMTEGKLLFINFWYVWSLV